MHSTCPAVPVAAPLSETKRFASNLVTFMRHWTYMMIALTTTIVYKSGGLTPFSTGGILFAILSVVGLIGARKYVRANVTPAEEAQVPFLETIGFTLAGVLIPFFLMTFVLLAPYLR